MALSMETYALCKQYTDDSIAGAGAIEGKPCQIQSITSITGGNRVTFLWVDNEGSEHTSTMDVMNGQDGQDGADGTDGIGIKSVAVNSSNHLIITYTNDTVADAGEIDVSAAVNSVNGKTGTVTLDASDVGALPSDTTIPSALSQLSEDTTHRVVTDTEKSTWNGKQSELTWSGTYLVV